MHARLNTICIYLCVCVFQELLSTEVVPPRGEVKGINYCIVFSVMAFFVFLIATLIFVFRIVH